MKKLFFYLALILIVSLFHPLNMLAGGGKFEGIITYKISLPDINSTTDNMRSMLPSEMILTVKGSLTRNEYHGGMANIISITNNNQKTTVNLMDMNGQKVGIKKNLDDIQKDMEKQPKPKVELFSDTKVIAGYTCKKAVVTVDVKGQVIPMEVWYTKELGSREMNYGNSLYREIDGMLMEFSLKNRDLVMKYVATSVDKKQVPDSVFDIPASYKIMTQEELRNMMTGGQQH